MPRETVTLELWTDYAAAGGTRKGDIPIAAGGVTAEVSGDAKIAAEVPRQRWVELGGSLRDVLRVTWPEGTVEEARVRRISDTDEQTLIALEALQIFDDLVTGGPILRVVNGSVVTRLADEVRLSTWLASYILPHESAQRIGLTLGTLARDPVIPGEFDAKSVGAVIRALFDAAGLEVELVRAGDSGWVLNGPLAIGDAAPTLTVERGRTQLDLTATVDDAALASVVIPLGADDPDTGDRATIANVRYEVSALPSSGWVSLVDPETNATPILLDQQWVGAALRLPDTTTRTILAARASDGSVQLTTTTGVTVGTRVGMVAVDGSPLVEVFDAGGGSAPRIVPKTWSTLRGEANELTNGRFKNGLTGWSAANAVTPPAYAEVYRSELGVTRSFQANVPGGRPAGTGTGTALNVDGLPAGSRVLRGEVIDQAGSTHALSAAAIPSPTGALTLSLATGLPAAYTDNEPITLVRRELATMTTGISTPKAGGYAVLSNADAALIQRLVSFAVVDNVTPSTSDPGDVFLVGPGGETFNNNLVGLYAFDGDPNKIVVRYPGFGGTSAGAVGSFFCNTYSVVSAQRLKLYYFGGSGSVGTTVVVTFNGTYFAANMPAWCAPTGYFTFVGTVVSTGSDGGGTYILADWLGVPASASLLGFYATVRPNESVSLGPPVVSTPAPNLFSYNDMWSGSFALTWARERRTLRFDGAASLGATTVAFKAISALARRDWTNTDTLYNQRPPIAMTLRATAVNLGASTLTIDLANSTAQNYQDLWPYTVFVLTGSFLKDGDYVGTHYIVLTGISGTTVSFTVAPSESYGYFDTANSTADAPQTCPATSSPTSDSYAVTGAASWASTGLATVPISIPSGRTLYAGAKVWSNFHGTGPSDTLMIVATTVVGPASSVSVRASDGYPNDWDGVTTPPNALWRVGTDSYLEVLGNRLVVAATATVNGSGQAALTLTAPNTNAIPDNVALSFTRPQLLRPSDPTDGSVVWLLSPPGGVTSATPGLGSTPVLIPVPTGTTRVVTALVTFSLPAGVYPVGEQPAIAIVDAAGNVLTTAPLATNQVTVLSTPTVARIILQVTLTASTTLAVRVYGGCTDPTLRAAVLDAMLCITARDDVPFTASSWANQLAQRGIDVLAAQRLPVAEVSIDVATLRRWSDAAATNAPIVLGQKVRVAALGVTRRILTLTRSLTNPHRATVTVGAVSTDLTRRVAATAGG